MIKTLLYSLLFISCLAGVSAQIPQYIKTAGLQAWYPFNGNTKDESTNGRDLDKYYTTLTTDRFGKANSAYSFDGLGSYLKRVNFPAIQNSGHLYTISAWVKPRDTATVLSILQLGKYSTTANTSTSWLYVTPKLVSFSANQYVGVDVPYRCSSVSPATSAWTHVAIEYDGNAFYLYVNGDVVCTKPPAGTPVSIMSDMTIGALYVDNVIQSFFNGAIDDVAIYAAPLFACDVKTIYNSCTLTQPKNQSAVIGNNVTMSVQNDCWSEKGITYQWQVDNGTGFQNVTNAGPFTGATTKSLAISNVTTAMNNTQYQCIIKNDCGAVTTTNPAKLTVTLTGVEELAEKGTINLYPNPSNGYFNLDYDLPFSDAVFTVSDMLGREVYSITINGDSGTKSLDLSSLGSGIYGWNISHGTTRMNFGKVSIIN